MNTDAVEWFSRDAHQFVGGSTNKMSAKGMGQAATKADACSNGRHAVHGNNKAAHDALVRQNKW